MNLEKQNPSPAAENSSGRSDEPKPSVLLGDFLKAKREEKDLSLQVLSQKTKINISLLKSLEENQFEKLPNKTYVRGFIKSYCRELGLNLDEALKIFEKTFESIKPESKIDILDVHHNDDFDFQFETVKDLADQMKQVPPKFYKVGGFVLAAILFVGFVTYQLFQAEPLSTPVVRAEKALEESNPTAPLEQKTSTESGAQAQEASKLREEEGPTNITSTKVSSIEPPPPPKAAPPQPVKAEPPAPAKIDPAPSPSDNATTSSQTGGEGIQLAKDYRFLKMDAPLYRLEQNQEIIDNPDIFPTDMKNAFITGVENLFIHATKGDCWITYKKDDERIKSFTLQKGRHLLIRGETIRIFFGNINAVDIFLNNQHLVTDSSNGVKSLVIPQKEASKYVTPLFIRDIKGEALTSYEYLQSQR